MTKYTLTTNDVKYIEVYIKDKSEITGSITPHDLSGADSIVFRMRLYGSTANAIEVSMETVATPSCTLGFCRALVTIPAIGNYVSEYEVFEGINHDTWEGHTYKVRDELG